MNKHLKIVLLTATLAGSLFLLVSWRRKSANTAARFIDEIETGANAGFVNKTFEKMMREVGWKSGEAWCMYFGKVIYLESYPAKAAIINQVFTGSTQQTWKNALASDDFKVITAGKPQVGDIVIWQNTNNPGTGHAGIVYKKQSGDTWFTIEGNTNLQGAREGEGVKKATRLLVPGTVTGGLKLLGFIRFKNTII